jgi:hypothetical protein
MTDDRPIPAPETLRIVEHEDYLQVAYRWDRSRIPFLLMLLAATGGIGADLHYHRSDEAGGGR